MSDAAIDRIGTRAGWILRPGLTSNFGRIKVLRTRTIGGTAGIISVALLLAGCGSAGQHGSGGRDRGNGGPVRVGYVVARATSVPIPVELPGRTVAYQSSEVRPQVSGVIQKRFFTEGSIVKQGQPLYQIDPSLYRAAANQASANLASAEATAAAAKTKSDRYRPLAQIEAVSKQDYTDALAAERQAQASVLQNKAQLDTARINLRFTTVPAPITGRIGRSLFTVGALVTTSQADPLTSIQQLDPIYVDIQQSSAALLALRRGLATGGAVPTRAVVRLKLEDGEEYGLTGSVEFAEAVVDPATGTITLRARFANPNGLLLPGMFVRAVFNQSIDPRAILVPQAAVSRDPKGNATVWVVGPGNKALPRTVTTARVEGSNWVVTGGLSVGDRIITQGTSKLQADAAIDPVPADTPQRIAPPQQGQGKKAG